MNGKKCSIMKAMKNGKAKSLCIGSISMLKSAVKDLICCIFETREQGMGVQISTMILKPIPGAGVSQKIAQ